jgi:DNA-nicking Smr family endonuclease
MKRARPPDLTPPSPRRKRTLDREERELWEMVTKAIKPIRRRPKLEKPLENAVETTDAVLETVTPGPILPPRTTKAPAPPLAPLGRRERSQLSRGRKEIDARLDLHGMTQARAHRALRSFLVSASENGMTFVLVITGKGRSAAPESERGVLRRQVPEWLSLPEFRSLVVGFEEAHIGHGGAGALYVRVRRLR